MKSYLLIFLSFINVFKLLAYDLIEFGKNIQENISEIKY